MRICFIALGTFTHIGAYIDYFKAAGHDVHFIALTPGPDRNVPTYNVAPFGFRFKPAWKGWYLLAMLRARIAVRKIKPDIVHAHYATSSGLAAWICGVHPYLVTAHGTDLTLGVKSALWRPILRQIFRDADCVNVVSDQLKDMALDLGIEAQKVEMLTLGINTGKFCIRNPVLSLEASTAAPIQLICTRRFETVYDHRTLLKAMAILAGQQKNFRLTLVGDGPLRQDLQAQTRELGLLNRVTFMGNVTNSRLPALLAEHDVYLSASLRDGTSLSLLEAMASGLYPIVSDIQANQSWIRDGYNGYLHKISDPQHLAVCIRAFRRQEGSASQILAYNRELVVQRGCRVTNMQRLEAIYCQLKPDAGKKTRF